MLQIVFLIFHILFAILILYLTIAFITGAPFVPSTSRATSKMLEFAHIQTGNNIYDLGSGDGRILFASSKRGANAIGYEINPFLVALTRLKNIFNSNKKLVRIYWKNFWNANLADADVVFVYLLPWKMDRLAQKLKKEMKPGSLVITNSFIFPGWKINEKDETVHVYSFKMR